MLRGAIGAQRTSAGYIVHADIQRKKESAEGEGEGKREKKKG